MRLTIFLLGAVLLAGAGCRPWPVPYRLERADGAWSLHIEDDSFEGYAIYKDHADVWVLEQRERPLCTFAGTAFPVPRDFPVVADVDCDFSVANELFFREVWGQNAPTAARTAELLKTRCGAVPFLETAGRNYWNRPERVIRLRELEDIRIFVFRETRIDNMFTLLRYEELILPAEVPKP